MRFRYESGARPLDGYTIRRPLGEGGFGEVYHAESDVGKQVALKLVQHSLDIELRGVRHCLNIKHPNLITIYDLKTDAGGEHWIVMEFVDGLNLGSVITRTPGGLAVPDVMRWLEGICSAVEQLHQAGVVHRDLKPSNIFDDNGQPKVGDYGLSKFITASKRSGHTQSVGTLHYMAPEVGSGRYGREVDIYAIGIILYEMLTGEVPFDGETATEILMKHLTGAPDLSRLPPAFRPVVGRMLAKRPEDRYGSPAAVVADLKARLSDANLVATTAGADVPESVYDPSLVSLHSMATSRYPRPMEWRPKGWIGKSLHRHPILFSLSVFLLLLLLTPLVVFGAYLSLAPPPSRFARETPYFLASIPLWALFSLVVAGAVCAWAILWQRMSNDDRPPNPNPRRPPEASASERPLTTRKQRFATLFVSVLIGAGTGVLLGSIVSLIVESEFAIAMGFAGGLMTVPIAWCLVGRGLPHSRFGRALMALMFSTGVGVSVGGLAAELFCAEEEAVGLGFGVGFLCLGLIGFGLLRHSGPMQRFLHFSQASPEG